MYAVQPRPLRARDLLRRAVVGFVVAWLLYSLTGGVPHHWLNLRYRLWRTTGIGYDADLTPELMKVDPEFERSMRGRSCEAARWWFPRLEPARDDDPVWQEHAAHLGGARLLWLDGQHYWGVRIRDDQILDIAIYKP